MALVYWAAVLAVAVQATSIGASPYRRLRQPSDHQQLPAILDKRVHDGITMSLLCSSWKAFINNNSIC